MSLKSFIFSKVFLKNLGIAIALAVGSVMILMIWLNIYTRHGQARAVPDFVGLTMDETVRLAKKSRLRYQIIDSVYTSAVGRGCVAEQNPKPGFKVKKWRNIVLTINAFHPEMVVMPDLIDLPLRQAKALIESSGLTMGQLRYKPDLSINNVIQQMMNNHEVITGDSIPKGAVIDLVLGKGLSNQRTPVPDLLGLLLDEAKDKILFSSLNLGTFIYDSTIVNNDDTLNAFVYKQNPEYKEEATLQMGSDMYLWLTVDSAKLPSDSLLILSDTIPAPEIVNKRP